MEFQEFCKQRERMCSTIKKGECNLFYALNGSCITCKNDCIEHYDTAEKIVSKWAKEHPIITNADKFKEVFGKPIGSYGAPCPNGLTIYENGTMTNIEWLNQEYKEPEGENEKS